MARLALEGLRILDVTQVWAGPTCTKILGDMGAQVIKVESAKRTDSSRGDALGTAGMYPDNEPGEHPWNRAGLHNDRNRSKMSVCLDLTHPKGVETFKRLVAESDVVTESFRNGVMERFGLGYEALKAVKPDLIMVSLSSQGGTGPERSYGSYGATLEQTAGIASVTGYLGGTPTTSGTFFPDPVVAILGIGTILAAVRQQRLTGQGTYIDLSQREVTTSILGEMVMDYTMNGRTWSPMGNRHIVHAPQGVYPCAGDDAWIAITVRSDDEWIALARTIGRDDLAASEEYATVVGRRAHHDEIDATIARWTQSRAARDVMEQLQAAGVPAGIAQRGSEILVDPHLNERGFWEVVDDPEGGRHTYLSRPFQFSKTPGETRSHAPLLGEHTTQVLRDVAGLNDEEIAELDRLGVTANDPLEILQQDDDPPIRVQFGRR